MGNLMEYSHISAGPAKKTRSRWNVYGATGCQVCHIRKYESFCESTGQTENEKQIG